MWIISWQVVSVSQSDGVSSSSVSQCFRSLKTQATCDSMVAVPASQLSCFPWLQHVPDSASTGVIKGGCWTLPRACPGFLFHFSLLQQTWHVMYGVTVISWLSPLEVHEMMFNLITASAIACKVSRLKSTQYNYFWSYNKNLKKCLAWSLYLVQGCVFGDVFII